MKTLSENFIPTQLKFFPETGELLLDIEKEYTSSEAMNKEAEKLKLLIKKEFHLIIIGSKTGEKILELIKNFDSKKQKNILENIKNIGEDTSWKVQLINEYFYIKKDYKNIKTPDIRESIIQMAIIEGLEDFYKKLNAILDTNFLTPLPHITLYTNSTRKEKKLRGIGIYSKEKFEELQPQKVK